MDQKEIGKRLKEIREKHYAKFKLSISDFADELGEKMFNIANYEAGKANLPNRVLVALYDKGFNPSFILIGEGPLFADNYAGRQRAKQAGEDIGKSQQDMEATSNDLSKMTIEELFNKAIEYNAAADDIMKYLKKRREDSQHDQ
jgi:transcriptional regulator with XRE-family HTH domain